MTATAYATITKQVQDLVSETGGAVVLSLWRGMIATPHPTMAGIAAAVAEVYGITVADLKGCARARHIAWPRQHAMAMMYATGRYSLPQIGRFFGGRDHSTIIWGIRAHQGRALELDVAA